MSTTASKLNGSRHIIAFMPEQYKNKNYDIDQMRPKSATYTIVEYRYRDYGNWKFYGCFSLSGKFNWDAAKPFLFEEVQFIPREVGWDSLTPKEMNEDDHWLHEIISTTIVSECKIKPLMTSAEFVRRIKKASSIGWLELCPWV